MALGNSYPESGGKNRSAIHWDILKDMKKDAEIYADKQLFYKNGKFLIWPRTNSFPASQPECKSSQPHGQVEYK